MSIKTCGGVFIVALLVALFPYSVETLETSRFPSTKAITKDVLIIGGGASGAYAAVRLREDFKKSVVVIEKQDHLVCPAESRLTTS